MTSSSTFAMPTDPTAPIDLLAAAKAFGIQPEQVSNGNKQAATALSGDLLNIDNRMVLLAALIKHAAEAAGSTTDEEGDEHPHACVSGIVGVRGKTHTHHIAVIQGRGDDLILITKMLLKSMSPSLRRSIIVDIMGEDLMEMAKAEKAQKQSNAKNN